jgi:hypothetical protein
LTPHNAAHAFAAHDAVRGDFLRADALVERPEADGSVVTGGHGFSSVFAEGEGGDGGGVGEHLVGALALRWLVRFRTGHISPRLTRVGVEEPDVLVFVPTDNNALQSTTITRASWPMNTILVWVTAPRL